MGRCGRKIIPQNNALSRIDIFPRISNITRSANDVFIGSLAQSVEQQAFNLLVLRSNRRRPNP